MGDRLWYGRHALMELSTDLVPTWLLRLLTRLSRSVEYPTL